MTNIANAQNPFFERYTTPHGTAPLDKIKTEHYKPAIREGISRQAAEIDTTVNNSEIPTFTNTTLAYEQSGELLDRVTTVFDNLHGVETSDDLQQTTQEMMPLLSEHSNNISLNEALSERIKTVYLQKDLLELTPG